MLLSPLVKSLKTDFLHIFKIYQVIIINVVLTNTYFQQCLINIFQLTFFEDLPKFIRNTKR